MASAAHRSATELCQVLLENFFGAIVASVAGTLLRYGRLDAATLSRKTAVSPKLTRQALVVLIQHSIVQFSTVQEGGNDKTFYHCNWSEVLNMQKIGTIMRLASQEVSAEAAAIVKYVAIYGKVKAQDLMSAFASSTAADSLASRREFEGLVIQLLEKKILRPVHIHEAQPIEEYKQSIRNRELASMKKDVMTETKKAVAVESTLARHMAELHSEVHNPEAGLKRKANGATENGRSVKRKRLNNGENGKAGASSTDMIVDPEVMLRINHDKFNVIQRNEELITLCQKRLGATPAAVYRHVLNLLESKITHCRQDTSDLVISTLTISRALPGDLDLGRVWVKERATSSKKKKGKRKVKSVDKKTKSKKRRARHGTDSDAMSDASLDEADDDDEEEDNDEDDASDLSSFIEQDSEDIASDDDYASDDSVAGKSRDRLRHLNQFLELFAQDSIPFLKKLGTRSMGEWHVDYAGLAKVLRQLQIESLINEKLGDMALRLLRIVQAKLKIEEKQLATTALLRQKHIRRILHAMHEMGVLDLQEVPRGWDRLPSKTFYLWYHNADRANSSLAQNLCRAMTRTRQRLACELKHRDRLLTKSQRTDVRNREADFLSRDELLELRRIRAMEEKMLTQCMRLANSYAILTEY